MINWKNLDELDAYRELEADARVDLPAVMSGENGAERVKKYCTPMAEGLVFNYAAKAVDDKILASLAKLAEEQQLVDKYEALLNGEMITEVEQVQLGGNESYISLCRKHYKERRIKPQI